MWTSFTFFGKSFVTISLLLFATMLVVTNADKDNKKECDNDKQCFKNAVCNSDHECTCKTWQIYERTGKSEKCTDVKCKTDKGCSELNKILSPTADIYSCNTKTGLCQCDPVKGKLTSDGLGCYDPFLDTLHTIFIVVAVIAVLGCIVGGVLIFCFCCGGNKKGPGAKASSSSSVKGKSSSAKMGQKSKV